jgi:hypothetical protein
MENDLNDVLNKVKEAGGRVSCQKTIISDDEGTLPFYRFTNKLALHSKIKT